MKILPIFHNLAVFSKRILQFLTIIQTKHIRIQNYLKTMLKTLKNHLNLYLPL